jgi:NSS family neurotransmitter:Na+ symporter
MAFILAVTGSAVGLGNIWKFPYVAGQNGGGAFVIVYLLCVFLIGMPVMMSEILIGRRGRRNPVATMALLGEEEGSSSRWKWIGALGVVAGILILSYYSVIAGWTLAYIVKSVSGAFTGASAAAVGAEFGNFVGDWRLVALCHTLFMSLTIFVVARGVERGLEQAVRFMVPALLAHSQRWARRSSPCLSAWGPSWLTVPTSPRKHRSLLHPALWLPPIPLLRCWPDSSYSRWCLPTA